MKNYYYGLGLGIDRQGATVIISNILESSPAYKAGIVLGDTLEMIDNIPVNDQWLSIDYCSFLNKVNRLLSNDSISIKIKNKEVVQIKKAKF